MASVTFYTLAAVLYLMITDRPRLTVAVMLTCAVVMYAIFLCVMPLYADDLWFSSDLRHNPGWEGVTATWYDHYLTDNARLGNILLVPLLLLPKFVGSSVAALCWGWALWKGGETAGLRSDRWPGWAVWLALTCFLLPWYDSIGSLCYQMNYLVPTALTLLAARMAARRPDRRPLLCFAAGLTAGMWHEGFSIPLVCGLAAAIVCFRPMRDKRVAALTLGVATGIVWLLACPGFTNRMQMVTQPATDYFFTLIGMKTILHPALLLLVLAIAILSLRREAVRQLKTPLDIILLVSAAASYVIHLASLLAPRSGWWCEFASMILLIRVCSHIRLPRSCPALGRGIALLLGLLTLWRLANIDMAAIHISRDFRQAMSQYEENPAKSIFMDFPTEHDAPAINLLAPDYTLFLSPVYRDFHNGYLGATDSTEFIVTPAALRRVTSRSGETVAGTAGVRRLDGLMYMPSDSLRSYEFSADVDFGVTRRHGVRMLALPFRSEADSCRYVWLYPWRQVILMKLGDITRVDR